MSARPGINRKTTLLISLIGALLYFAVVTGTVWNDSATFDEPVHISSGYLCLSRGSFILNSFHPPLLKMVASLPLVLQNPDPPVPSRFDPARLPETLTQWFWRLPQDPQTVLRACRVSLLVMQAALVWGILFAMTVRFGARPAVGFFVLALLSPSYVGLAGYVITDSGMMLWMVLTLLAWERVVTRGIRRDTLLLALCLFAGMASKHSFLLIPACLLVGTLGWGAIHRLRNRQEESQRFISLARKILLALVGALSLVYLLYAFSMRNMNTKVVEVYLRHFSRQSPPMLSEALEFSSRQRVLYPAGWYVAGVFRVVDMVHKGPSEIKIISSFGNQVYQGGRYFYFPAILMAKENLLVILLLAVIWLKKAREPWSKEARAIIVPSLVIALCYFLIAIRGSVNIGYRHIMPAYVCFLLATVLLLRQNGRGRFVDGALLGLLICRLTSLALTYPHQLSYFNWLAGGVKDGYKTSVISDADWGQDLLRLRDYVASRPPSRVHLFYASAADTGYYLGPLRALPPEPFRSGDLVAVSTTFLMIPDYLPADRLERLNLARTFPVDGQIGGSLVIFKVPPGY